MKKSLCLAAALIGVSSPSAQADPFFARMALRGVTFQVESPNDRSINPVTIRAETSLGLLGEVEVEADGVIANVEVADLDANGHPEVYVYVTSAGSGSYGSLIAYASNRSRSLSEIHLPPLEGDSDTAKGYMGHDEFAVGEGALLRRFPVYREVDPNARPSGGQRQIRYELEAGEAGWVLRPERVVEY